MGPDYRSILWNEFFAEEGSFLLQLRVDFYWDKAAFDRLTEAMRECCKDYEREQRTEEQRMLAIETMLPRWLASGFWYLSVFVPSHISHPVWKEKLAREPEYFHKACDRLQSLASWFFEGQSPWDEEEKGWASTFVSG